MNASVNESVKAILDREEAHSVGVRASICRHMEALGYGAVLWGQNVFGTTNYPLVSDQNGKEYGVHGLAFDPGGSVCAVIAYPEGKEEAGVKAYSVDEAARLISPSILMCVGTPEEWDVLGDCFQTVLQILKADHIEQQPLPWW